MDTENLVLTVLGGVDQRLLFGALHDLPDALALGDFQLFQKVIQYRIQPVGGDFRLLHLLLLPGKISVQLLQHGGGIFHHLFHIELHQRVQPVNPNVVAGAAGASPAVIGAAGVGGLYVAAAHGKHGTAAVPTFQKA